MSNLILAKALTIEPEAGAVATVTGRLFPSHPSGSVTIRELMFVKSSALAEVRAQGSYADVLLESSTFVGSGASFGVSSVADAHVVVREVDFLGGRLSGLNVSGAPHVDVLDSYFEGHTGLSSLQYQLGTDGMILRNRFLECGWRGCIRVVRAGTVLIADNTIQTSARTEVFQAEFGRGVVIGLMADGVEVVAERNVVEGIGATLTPSDRVSYPMSEGALTALDGASTTFRSNVVRNAGAAIQPNFVQSLRMEDNVISDVHTALELTHTLTPAPATRVVAIGKNDFVGYLVSIQLTGSAVGSTIPTGALTCNWWGSLAGPQNTTGATPSLYTPFATAPIAGTGRAC